jgi:tRNA dimethylallyltransferase
MTFLLLSFNLFSYLCGMEMITILGPTACGKTRLAIALAAETGGEIISGDSRQVYRGMDIGTGKDLCDYTFNGRDIPFHLINICDPGTKYNLFEYQKDFQQAFEDIRSRGRLPILCGGTGLYIESVLKGYNLSPVPKNEQLRKRLEGAPLHELVRMLEELKQKNGLQMHNVTDVDTAQRAIRAIEIEEYNLNNHLPERQMSAVDSLTFGIDIPRDERRQRITARLKQRLQDGMIDEIKGLLAGNIPAEDLIYYGLEYKYVTEYVIGRISYDDMFSCLEIAIHQFAKRQMTWFRGMERRGTMINWLDWNLPESEKVKIIIKTMNEKMV